MCIPVGSSSFSFPLVLGCCSWWLPAVFWAILSSGYLFIPRWLPLPCQFPCEFFCLEYRRNYIICFLGELRKWDFFYGEISMRLWTRFTREIKFSISAVFCFIWKSTICWWSSSMREIWWQQLCLLKGKMGLGASCGSTFPSGLSSKLLLTWKLAVRSEFKFKKK